MQLQDGCLFMSLQEISVQVQECKKCRLWQTAKHGVPGEGPLDAKIMFVGQNPGSEEDQTGRPFVGRAGKFLTKTLAEYGIKREDVYITNIVKHTSPENRKPYPDEVTACIPYLNQQIALIKPKIIVLLGASAKETPRVEGIEYFEIVHPSAAMRFTKMREKFRGQIEALTKRIQQVS
jgi:DNA polymerase